MYSVTRWICTNNNKNLYLKIIYPGGRVEIHDQPVLAAELLRRNPKCCVAHPTVFRHPYAVVSSSTTLALGQIYYIVPIGTIKKLQLQNSSKQASDVRSNDEKKKDGEKVEYPSSCWLMMRNKRDGCEVECGKRKVGLNKYGDHKAAVISSNHWQPALERILEE